MENLSDVIKTLKLNNIIYESDILLSNFTNTHTGGSTPLLVSPKSVEELKTILSIFRQFKIKYEVLSGMTNVVIASGKLNFAVLNMSKLIIENPKFDKQTNILTVYAGTTMKNLSKWAIENSISGLQWMEGIPGTVGAGAYMNAGFLPNQDFEHVLIDCKVMMSDGTIRTYTNKEMNFSYRKTSIQNLSGIIISMRLLVRVGNKMKIALKTHRYHRRRVKNQPLEFPSAGTVFVPPTPYHVGGMLPALGMVGFKVGGAQISSKSPGFIINTGNMTGEDYFQLVKLIQKKVYDIYTIKLLPEVRLLGFEDIKKDED